MLIFQNLSLYLGGSIDSEVPGAQVDTSWALKRSSGGILGLLLGILCLKMAILELILSILGHLGPHVGHLGASWSHLGAIYGSHAGFVKGYKQK